MLSTQVQESLVAKYDSVAMLLMMGIFHTERKGYGESIVSVLIT